MNGGNLLGSGGTVTVSGVVSFDGAPSNINNVTLATSAGSTTSQGVTGGATVMLSNGAVINNSGAWTMADGSSVVQLGVNVTNFTNAAGGTLTVTSGNAD